MSWGAVAVAGATIITGYMSQQQQAQAQAEANRANVGMSKQEIAERRRQFDIGREDTMFGASRQEDVDRQLVERFQQLRGENVERLDPYSQAGQAASTQRAGMLGLGTPEEQREAESRFTESPGQRFLRERQEKTIMRTAAARGGLGGGNVMTALQEQAFGRAQTARQQYLSNLGQVSGEGMKASGQIIGMGQGPQVGVTDVYGERLSELEGARESAATRAEEERRRKEEERRRRQSNQRPTIPMERGGGFGETAGPEASGEDPDAGWNM